MGNDIDAIDRALAIYHSDSADDLHSVVSNAVDFNVGRTDLKDPRIGRWIYENSPCMHCRRSAIEWLMSVSGCPPWMMEEARWDADEAIWDIVRTTSQE